jgi:hypothetical protein
MKRRPVTVTTKVTRELGPAFDPETRCEYTGRRLWQFPISARQMGYWREDRVLIEARAMTPEEKAWIAANPQAYARECAEFETWRNS